MFNIHNANIKAGYDTAVTANTGKDLNNTQEKCQLDD